MGVKKEMGPEQSVWPYKDNTRDPYGDGNVLYLYFIKIKALSVIYSTTVLQEATLGGNWVKSAWDFSVLFPTACVYNYLKIKN